MQCALGSAEMGAPKKFWNATAVTTKLAIKFGAPRTHNATFCKGLVSPNEMERQKNSLRSPNTFLGSST